MPYPIAVPAAGLLVRLPIALLALTACAERVEPPRSSRSAASGSVAGSSGIDMQAGNAALRVSTAGWQSPPDTLAWADSTARGDTTFHGKGRLITSSVVLVDSQWIQVPVRSAKPGIPVGLLGLWDGTRLKEHSVLFTLTYGTETPSTIVARLGIARARGIKMVTAMTGGARRNYLTDGVFDFDKWKRRMDAYNTPAIRDAVAQAVNDGTLIGNSVMDEPQQSDRDSGYRTKSWGPAGTMTKARVDGLCAYVKNIFPTLPVGVFHVPIIFEPDSSYRVCEFLIAQYDYRKGEITSWRDAGLAMAKRDGIAILFSLNILDGGKQDKDGVWDCANTGGLGTFSPNCAMTPEQIRNFGKVLGPSGCALTTWRYDATFVGKPENQAAISDVAITLSRLPREPCIRTRLVNTPPTAAFSSVCTNLDCSFLDESADVDGTVMKWSWDFGDGSSSSTERHPSHSYNVEGSYQVTLVVTDDKNATGTLAQTITAIAPPTSAAGP
jgi:hypothetical protein